jgi:hypothetical protein
MFQRVSEIGHNTSCFLNLYGPYSFTDNAQTKTWNTGETNLTWSSKLIIHLRFVTTETYKDGNSNVESGAPTSYFGGRSDSR